MVTVGTLELGVNVKNAVQSQKKVEKIKEEYKETADNATEVSDDTSMYSDVLDTAGEVMSGVVTRLQRLNTWLNINTSGVGIFRTAISKLIGTMSALAGVLGISQYLSLSAVWGALAGAASAIGGAVVSAVAALGTFLGVSTAVAGAIVVAVALVAGLASEILGITDVTPVSKEAVLDFANTIGGKVKNVAISGIKTIANGLENLIKSAATTAIDFVTDKVDGIVNSVTSIPGKVKSGVADIAPSPNLPDIPSLNGGGVIRQDGLAMVHENEAIIPLDNSGADVDRATNTSDSTSTGSTTEVTNNMDVTVRATFDDNVDVANMSRAERRKFVKEIAGELGDDILGRID